MTRGGAGNEPVDVMRESDQRPADSATARQLRSV